MRSIRLTASSFLALVCAWAIHAEVIFQDAFQSPPGNITNSLPWLDVQGAGWQSPSSGTQLFLDADGHVYNGASKGAAAGVPLVPIGPHGRMTILAPLLLPTNSTEWVGLGFASSNLFLSSPAGGSGPWLKLQGNGTITLYGGAGTNNGTTVTNAFTNPGRPFQGFLTWDNFSGTASAGTIENAGTNVIFNQWPVTNSTGEVGPHYLSLEFSPNVTAPTACWVGAVTVDWLPRPPPMLTLPVAVQQTNLVGAPGANDILLIQNAFNAVSGSTVPTEIRFEAGATYVISNNSLTAGIPNALFHATNVLVNGNGCKILIANPRLGFMSVNSCSNVIVENFSVDHDPLPYTQGTVTHNFFTNRPSELAIEFQVDAGYPAATNANYIDASASANSVRWGTVMDPTNLGRGADNSYPACIYTNVAQTNLNGAFKVFLAYPNQAKSIPVGARWNMISRWNGSSVFYTYASYQVTWLNNTNYAGAGLSYGGAHCPLVSEVGDQIVLGPPPAGGSAPRLRTSNADGGYFGETRVGPWVEGCNFTALSDDCANPYLSPFIVTNITVQPTNTLALFDNPNNTAPVPLNSFQAQVGDEVLFMNPSNGGIFDRAKITAVNLPNVTFDHALSNLVAGTYDKGTLLLNTSLNTSAVYLNNRFSNGRQHGIYCRADNILIAHNTISGMELNAIAGFPALASTFLNFFAPTNAVILANVLSDSSYSEPAISNAIPTAEPAFALVDFHQASLTSNYVTNDLEISGVRILYNAFLNWRRAPISLRNVTDVKIIGNYFGPPITKDNLVPLTNDVIADFWAADLLNARLTNNVNATGIANVDALREDGTNVSIADALELPVAPKLTASVSGTNFVVSWISPAPGYVLQQIGSLSGSPGGWSDIPETPWISGQSNSVVMPLLEATNQFFRARLR